MNRFILVIIIFLILLSTSGMSDDNDSKNIDSFTDAELINSLGLKNIIIEKESGVVLEGNKLKHPQGTELSKEELEGKSLKITKEGFEIIESDGTSLKLPNNLGKVSISETSIIMENFGQIKRKEGLKIFRVNDEEIRIKGSESIHFESLEINGDINTEYLLTHRKNGDLGVTIEKGEAQTIFVKGSSTIRSKISEGSKYYVIENGKKHGIDGKGKINVVQGSKSYILEANYNPILVLGDDLTPKKVIVGWASGTKPDEIKGRYREIENGKVKKIIKTVGGNGATITTKNEDSRIVAPQIFNNEKDISINDKISKDQTITIFTNGHYISANADGLNKKYLTPKFDYAKQDSSSVSYDGKTIKIEKKIGGSTLSVENKEGATVTVAPPTITIPVQKKILEARQKSTRRYQTRIGDLPTLYYTGGRKEKIESTAGASKELKERLSLFFKKIEDNTGKKIAYVEHFGARNDRPIRGGVNPSQHTGGHAFDLSNIYFTDGTSIRALDSRSKLPNSKIIQSSSDGLFSTVIYGDGSHRNHWHIGNNAEDYAGQNMYGLRIPTD